MGLRMHKLFNIEVETLLGEIRTDQPLTDSLHVKLDNMNFLTSNKGRSLRRRTTEFFLEFLCFLSTRRSELS